MKLYKDTVIYADSDELFKKCQDKLVLNENRRVVITTNDNDRADIRLYSTKPKYFVDSYDLTKTSYLYLENGKWIGRDYLSCLDKLSDDELIKKAVADSAQISNISLILADRGFIKNEIKGEPTDTEGQCYDISTTINDLEVWDHSNIWDVVSDERRLIEAYINNIIYIKNLGISDAKLVEFNHM